MQVILVHYCHTFDLRLSVGAVNEVDSLMFQNTAATLSQEGYRLKRFAQRIAACAVENV